MCVTFTHRHTRPAEDEEEDRRPSLPPLTVIRPRVGTGHRGVNTKAQPCSLGLALGTEEAAGDTRTPRPNEPELGMMLLPSSRPSWT